MPLADGIAEKLDALRQTVNVAALRAMPARDLLLLASRFERLERQYRERFAGRLTPLSVLVVASLSSQHLSSLLKLFLYAEGFAPQLRLSEFDGLATEGLDPEAAIWAETADAVVVLPALSDLRQWPGLLASKEVVAGWIDAQAARYHHIWKIAQGSGARRLYHALFSMPSERPLGNLEFVHGASRTRLVRGLNERMAETRLGNVTLVDFDFLSGLVGRQNWVDEPGYFLTKQPMALREMPVAAAYLARLIAAQEGRVRKCLVLDLDNTVWGGVVGDDGPLGIRVSPTDAVGEAFLAFQRYVLALKERGVILAACSKNGEANALAPFEQNPDMLLKRSDFASFVANWDDKPANVRRIAGELNIGVDSLVFFDDNPAERDIVSKFLPEVLVVDVPQDPALFIRALELSFAFEWPQLTTEDLARSRSYELDRERTDLSDQFEDYDSYLRSLEMTAEIGRTSSEGLPRLAQLFGKTNQFNVRTIRYSEQEIRTLGERTDYAIVEARFADKFSNYGVMAGAVLRFVGNDAFVENWIMSCRVFKRTLEHATLNRLAEIAAEAGADRLVAEYLPTAKNGYVETLFDTLGFRPLDGDPHWRPSGPDGKLYMLDLAARAPIEHFVAVKAQRADAKEDV